MTFSIDDEYQNNIAAAKAGCEDSINNIMTIAEPIIRSVVVARCARKEDSWCDTEDLINEVLRRITIELPTCKAKGWSHFQRYCKVLAHFGFYQYQELRRATI